MAFKFNKGQQVIGDLVSQDDPQRNTKIDFGDDQINFVVSGTVVASITPGQFSASFFVGDGSSLSGISGGGGGGSGNITSVTAGTNLTGGGTTGAVTLNLADTITLTTITASNWSGLPISLTVSGTSADGVAFDNKVSKIKFDNNTGFQVSQSATNEIEISIGSHYKNIVVNGQTTLVATGSDSLEIIGAGGVVITTSTTDSDADGVNKELTISTSAFSSSVSSSLVALEAKHFPASADGLPFYGASSTPSTLPPPSENRQNYVLGWVNNQLAWVLVSAAVTFSAPEYAEVLIDNISTVPIITSLEISTGVVV
jgi:hypothetical protein